MVSRTYPAYHPKKGQLTHFIDRIIYGIKYHNSNYHPTFHWGNDKIHTFRGNFPLWKKRIDEVLAGNAEIVLKYHSLGRYVKGNKQIEFVRLDKDSGVGVQPVKLYGDDTANVWDSDNITRDEWPHIEFFETIAKNDGLDVQDFKDWFEKGDYDMSEEFACIQFTKFRYGKALPTTQ